MSWPAVAKKDFRDAVQSRALWALVGVFVVVSTLMSYAYVELPDFFGGPTGPSVAGLIFFMAGSVSLFITLTAIVVCYKAIAGERELGSIKLLLALPHTRGEVLLGKVIGRAAVLAVAVAIGLGVGFGVGFALLGTIDVVSLVLFLIVTLLFTAVFAAIVVSLSATTGSTARATTLALGFFVVFELLWDFAPLAVVYVTNGFSLPQQMPDWVFLVSQLPPTSAYFSTLVAVLPDLASEAGAETGAGGIDAVYATPEIGIVVLAFWLVVPLAVGYYRFTSADL
ncbi:ABC transporter permease [Halobacteria archaeon AArc-m2/3/4]|uniref:ABC transporter permease n=1 Tax=Natronoglomus mannanivorans TaxID=2979990 RepID=A0AAP3E2V5_9EURY|nr:ABC transporter permease [Halobacteria archaeon AArc-xg1-1]MCU4973854.1 ABC transporter permease [Halobacteria archaeon AArc-m2/3/4]